MGISQLLPFLDKATRACHISEFRGKIVAIDTYCWLHKGARGCALELAMGHPTDQYVQYCLKQIKMLQAFNIKPIMVFDGRPLPAKLKTEYKRRDSKKTARKIGMEVLRLGKKEDAYKYFSQCIDVTPSMAYKLIQECRKLSVDCIVAPYESDAQLAYFSMNNMVDLVISEDSDLMVFGCKKVLYKMDYSGSGQLVDADKIHVSMNLRANNFLFDKFRHICILAGCDYLDSLTGIGLKKALKFITMTVETNPEIFINRIPRYLNLKNLQIPPDYILNFLIAEATFRHQIVFDPKKKILIPLTEVAEDKAQYCVNAGAFFDNNQAYELALGNLNPLTMERFGNWHPNETRNGSIWNSSEHRSPVFRPLSPTPSTSYECKRCDTKAVDEANAHNDEQIERELEFYKTPTKMDVVLVKTFNNIEDSDSQTSPILGNNPFLKTLNRFSASKNNSQIVESLLNEDDHTSTPPSSSTTQSDVQLDLEKKSVKLDATVDLNCNNTDDSNSVSPILDDESFIKTPYGRLPESKINFNKTVVSRFFSNVVGDFRNMNSFASSDSSASVTVSLLATESGFCDADEMAARLSEFSEDLYTVNAAESDLTESHADMDGPMVDCECIIHEDNGEIHLSDKGEKVELTDAVMNSVENLPSQENRRPSRSRKRKLEVDKPKRSGKKQMTIQDMFKKMRMK